MALLHFDGFDSYGPGGSTDVLPNMLGQYSSSGVSAVRVTTMPELGTLGLWPYQSISSSSGYVLKWDHPDGDSTTRTLGVGLHIYNAGTSWSSNFGDVGIVSVASQANSLNFNLRVAGGVLTLYRGSSTVLEVGPALDTGVLYHIEMKVTSNPGLNDSVEVRLNGATVIVADGGSGAATKGSVLIGRNTSSSRSIADLRIDNLFIWDGEGTENNDFLGERLVYTLMPDKDGPTQDWTLSTGSDVWDILNSIPRGPEYIEAANQGDVAQVGFESLPSLDITPIGVRLTFNGSKTGTAATEVGIAISGETPVSYPMTQDQQLVFAGEIYEINPGTGQPWTPGEINTIQADIVRTV